MSWLPTLKTETPEEGFQLAIKMSRMGVKFTQPDDSVRSELRKVYESDADSLIKSSQVVAINFQTVAQANGFWNGSDS